MNGDFNALNIIPWPEIVLPGTGCHNLKRRLAISFKTLHDHASKLRIDVFNEKIFKRFGVDANISDEKNDDISTLTVELTDSPPSISESYTLEIVNDISIKAPGNKGMFNALMTLLQLLYIEDGSVKAPRIFLKDAPRFSWRGTLIDPARNFLPVNTVKNFIDLICEFKLNVLHWHLVDDQGWRIESEAFPRLHATGGKKGFYSKAQIRDIISYAENRNIMVVPEIDMPGHTSAMIAAYPELSCTGRRIQIRQTPGIFKSALCISNEHVYSFIEGLFEETAELFKCPYVHIGSDEVVASEWIKHEDCIRLMNMKGIRDKAGLHAYFVSRIRDILSRYGKKMIAWDETARFIPENAVVQVWRDLRLAETAAKNGNEVIMSPTTHCYYDYPHLITSIEKVYDFDPVPLGFPKELENKIIGAEANLWGEWITPERLNKRAFPRMLAHSEVCWTSRDRKNRSDFFRRLKVAVKDLKNRGIEPGNQFEPLLIMWFGVMKLFEILFISRDEN